MANATGLCILCGKDVTEEDHRREVDCPSKTCPGRVYHEECITTYLRRTKYSKDRCTGFPCPAILQSGKPCPGYVCKMHVFFPSNPKKKQARLQAAIAAAAAPKPRPAPVKPAKAEGRQVAQVAIAAIKRATSIGTGSDVNSDDLPNSSHEDGGAFTAIFRKRLTGVSANVYDIQGRSNIPGAAAVPRAARGKLSPRASLPSSDNKRGDNNNNNNNTAVTLTQGSSIQSNPPGWDPPDSEVRNNNNRNNNDRNNRNNKNNYHNNDNKDDMGRNFEGFFASMDADTEAAAAEADQDEDPVVEYDFLYAAEDGSYLVLDALSNAYFRLEDVYGASPELLECAGEDGNMYTCVVVRKSQIESRALWQQAWFETQEQDQQMQEEQLRQQQQQERQLAVAVDGAAWGTCVTSQSLLPGDGFGDGQGQADAGASSCEDDTDVASLMQLLLCT